MLTHRSGSLSISLGRVLLVLLLATLACAATARADTATLSFTDAAGQSDPVAHVGRTMTLTGNTAVGKRVYLRWRAPGGAPCAPSASSDSGTASPNGYWDGPTINDASVNGNFEFKKTGQWGTAGTFQFCIWLADGESTSTTPITQIITFRAAAGTVSATVNPIGVQTGQAATVTVAGSSESATNLYAKVRAAGGAPCAASPGADSGSSLIDDRDVNGAFSVQATTTQSTAGTYLVCVWLADSSSSTPIAGPQPATFTVAAPPPPCVVPQLAAGTALPDVVSSLAAAHCVVGKKRYTPSRTYPRGTLVKVSPVAGTSLAPQGAVDVTLSTGRPCRVPNAPRGLRLAAAEARLVSAGCTVGNVRSARSRTRRRGTVIRFSRPAGTRLNPLARVGIVVSRGRR
jgi:hypothetical protein